MHLLIFSFTDKEKQQLVHSLLQNIKNWIIFLMIFNCTQILKFKNKYPKTLLSSFCGCLHFWGCLYLIGRLELQLMLNLGLGCPSIPWNKTSFLNHHLKYDKFFWKGTCSLLYFSKHIIKGGTAKLSLLKISWETRTKSCQVRFWKVCLATLYGNIFRL